MLWLCARFVHLPVESRPPASDLLAITDRVASRRVLIAANQPARSTGIEVGMSATAALLKQPQLRLVERSRAEERRALRALADWGLQFSSRVCSDIDRWLLWLEVGASLKYFDGLGALLARIEHGVQALRFTASIGIAATLEASALFSLYGNIPPASTRDDISQQVRALSMLALALEGKVLESLRSTGITTVGEVMEIPRAALARRFGRGVTDYIARLLGEIPDIRVPHRARERYERRYDFADSIHSLEGLLFPLRRVLQEFEGYLRGRDVAVQSVEVRLRHRDEPDTAFTLHTSAPIRDSARLFVLMRERLERTPWKSSVRELRLAARDFQAPEILQGDFFDDSERLSVGWTALLDKLRARLGASAVRQIGLRDDHRPEVAWCVVNDPGSSGASQPFPERPIWLVEPMRVRRPAEILGRPERIEAGWPSGTDISRDYYVAVSPEGARWWLYRDSATGEWFLHGLWG